MSASAIGDDFRLPLIYVAGPFRGPSQHHVLKNIREAEEWGLKVLRCGAMPVVPHALTGYYHGVGTDEFWLEATLELMRRCCAVLMMPKWRKSKGACGEREEAEQIGIPVFTTIKALKAWLNKQAKWRSKR